MSIPVANKNKTTEIKGNITTYSKNVIHIPQILIRGMCTLYCIQNTYPCFT